MCTCAYVYRYVYVCVFVGVWCMYLYGYILVRFLSTYSFPYFFLAYTYLSFLFWLEWPQGKEDIAARFVLSQPMLMLLVFVYTTILTSTLIFNFSTRYIFFSFLRFLLWQNKTYLVTWLSFGQCFYKKIALITWKKQTVNKILQSSYCLL